MSKKAGPTRVNLADYKDRKANEGSIDIDLADGPPVRIPPPELWSDEFTRTTLKSRAEGVDADPEDLARLILGDDEFDRFIAGGGTATLFHAIFMEHHGADPGESPASPSS